MLAEHLVSGELRLKNTRITCIISWHLYVTIHPEACLADNWENNLTILAKITSTQSPARSSPTCKLFAWCQNIVKLWNIVFNNINFRHDKFSMSFIYIRSEWCAILPTHARARTKCQQVWHIYLWASSPGKNWNEGNFYLCKHPTWIGSCHHNTQQGSTRENKLPL